MVRIRRFSRAAAAAGLVASSLALGADPVQAQTAAQTLSPGQAVTLTSPVSSLPQLADGRLNSYGIYSLVDGVSFTGQAGGVAAAAGAQLVVLHVVVDWDTGNTDGNIQAHAATLTLQSGSLSAPLAVDEGNYPTPSDAYYAVAIAAQGPAILTLSAGGLLPQSLNLRTGHRIGVEPTILYRDAVQPELDVTSGAVTNFTASTPAGTATGQFGVAEAFLAWWQPYSTTLCTNPAEAYLDVQFANSQLSVPGHPNSDIGATEALPAGTVRFQLPDGQVIPASVNAPATQQTDIFSGDFYAQVPADLTSVKVIVQPGTIPIQVPASDGFDTQNINLTFATPLATTVAFPSAAPPASSAPTSVGQAKPRHAGGNASVPIIIAVIAAVVLAAGAALFWNRRYRVRVPVRTLTWPPSQLSPGAVRVLTAPRLALPRPASTSEPGGEPVTEIGGDGSTHPSLAVSVLGPLLVEGLVRPIRRQSVRRLLVVLVLTPERPMGADELAMAISDHPDRDPKTASVHSYASILRTSLPPGLLPDAGPDGYRLLRGAVAVDWLALAAVAGEDPATSDWVDRATGALELVRGRPLAGGSWEGIEAVVTYMTATIERVARALAAHHLAAGDPAAAEWAIGKGILALRESPGLWEDRLVAAAAGSGYGLERAWAEAKDALGPDAALIADRYQQLRRQVADQPAANP